MTQPPVASTPDHLAVGYQFKLHLLGISPQISWRVLVRVTPPCLCYITSSKW